MNAADITGIALTHWHRDHTGGLAELISIAQSEGARKIKYLYINRFWFLKNREEILKMPFPKNAGFIARQFPDSGDSSWLNLTKQYPVALNRWGLNSFTSLVTHRATVHSTIGERFFVQRLRPVTLW